MNLVDVFRMQFRTSLYAVFPISLNYTKRHAFVTTCEPFKSKYGPFEVVFFFALFFKYYIHADHIYHMLARNIKDLTMNFYLNKLISYFELVTVD